MGSRNEADPAPAAHGHSSSATSIDRVKLEIKGAKLNASVGPDTYRHKYLLAVCTWDFRTGMENICRLIFGI